MDSSSDSDSDSRSSAEDSTEIDYKNDNSVFDKIISKHLNLNDFAKLSLSATSINSELQNIKKNFTKTKKSFPFVYNDNIDLKLTDKDIELRPKDDDDDEDDKNKKEFTNDFDKYYGTSIEVPEKESAYLNFESPSWEQEAKLNKILNTNQKIELETKSSLSEDIEKQFQLKPYRISARQKKKQNHAKNSTKLPGWFNMKKVTEITKEQQKDLDALQMRRVWNPKVFYKKNSHLLSKGSGDKAGFFQIGTVADSSTDYYTDRLPKKQRKQTIVDELLADHDLKSYNKRKLKYAMSKNSRLSLLHRRAKLKRAKQKIKQRKFARKGVDPNAGVKIVKTY